MVKITVQDSDTIVVGVREDNLLHCCDLSSDKVEEVNLFAAEMQLLAPNSLVSLDFHCS